MGFLDKLLGRKKHDDDAEGMQTAPPPATIPTGATPAEPPASQAENEPHEHGEHDHQH
jgi:hypothetical protein